MVGDKEEIRHDSCFVEMDNTVTVMERTNESEPGVRSSAESEDFCTWNATPPPAEQARFVDTLTV